MPGTAAAKSSVGAVKNATKKTRKKGSGDMMQRVVSAFKDEGIGSFAKELVG